MLSLEPRVPSNLNPFARELLEMLRGQPAARHIILGGGVALSHYHEYRETVDVNAWWVKPIDEAGRMETSELLRERTRELAARHGLDFTERIWGETQSYELRRGSKKIFSFQISFRDLQLDLPTDAHWPPMHIETFRENLGAKMRALVHRGAPRDFTDVAALCGAGIVTPDECWNLWLEKTPGGKIVGAKIAVLRLMEQIASRRPLEDIPNGEQRNRAAEVRKFIRDEFCANATEQP